MPVIAVFVSCKKKMYVLLKSKFRGSDFKSEILAEGIIAHAFYVCGSSTRVDVVFESDRVIVTSLADA